MGRELRRRTSGIFVAAFFVLPTLSYSKSNEDACTEWKTGKSSKTAATSLFSSFFSRNSPLCVSKMTMLDSNSCRDCSSSPSLDQKQKAFLEQYLLSEACRTDFSPKNWREILPGAKSETFTTREAGLYLLKWEKPGGFEAQKDLPVLMGILSNQEYCQKNSLQIKRALSGILTQSDILYFQIVDRYPHLKKILLAISEGSSTKSCITEKESERITQSVLLYIDQLLASTSVYNSGMENWEQLAPLSHVLKNLSLDAKERYSTEMSERLSDFAMMQSSLKDVFPPKIFQFAAQAIAPIFGDQPKSITDLVVIRQSNQLRPILLGTEPVTEIRSGVRPAYGFYQKSLEPFESPVLKKAGPSSEKSTTAKEIAWKHAGNEYRASVKANIIPRTSKIEVQVAPNYRALKKDGEFRGEIIAGENLGISDGKYFMDEYLEYFTGQGFEFNPNETKIEDLKSYLSNEIKSNRADYFVKESHTSGDDRNVMRISKKGNRLEGVRTRPDGIKEVVHLVYPTYEYKTSELISNAEFGTWIRERERKPDATPLIYFNRSCYSDKKAVQELTAAQSPLLVEIPATDVMYFFLNEEDTAGRIILDGFRNEKTYPELRADLAKNKKYREKTANGFIFPDEPEYQAKIWKQIQDAVDIEIEITDQAGRPYSLEQALGSN